MAAPPCSSWCRVSRGTAWRTTMNPLGLNYEFVQEANMCIGRSRLFSISYFLPRLVALFLVVTAANACWVMEQPTGSADCLPFHPRMDWFFNEVVYVARLLDLGPNYISVTGIPVRFLDGSSWCRMPEANNGLELLWGYHCQVGPSLINHKCSNAILSEDIGHMTKAARAKRTLETCSGGPTWHAVNKS